MSLSSLTKMPVPETLGIFEECCYSFHLNSVCRVKERAATPETVSDYVGSLLLIPKQNTLTSAEVNEEEWSMQKKIRPCFMWHH